MSRTLRHYLLSRCVLSRLKRTEKNHCSKCGRELKIGDMIISKRSTASEYGVTSKYWHEKCAKELNVI